MQDPNMYHRMFILVYVFLFVPSEVILQKKDVYIKPKTYAQQLKSDLPAPGYSYQSNFAM